MTSFKCKLKMEIASTALHFQHPVSLATWDGACRALVNCFES